MASDASWVEDVRHWFESSRNPRVSSLAAGDDVESQLGYEAAHPALQAAHWSTWPETQAMAKELPR